MVSNPDRNTGFQLPDQQHYNWSAGLTFDPGFDRTALPHAANAADPAKHLDVRRALGIRVGGFGILMTRGMVDEMTYNDAGNEVRLVKRFAGSKAAG